LIHRFGAQNDIFTYSNLSSIPSIICLFISLATKHTKIGSIYDKVNRLL